MSWENPYYDYNQYSREKTDEIDIQETMKQEMRLEQKTSSSSQRNPLRYESNNYSVRKQIPQSNTQFRESKHSSGNAHQRSVTCGKCRRRGPAAGFTCCGRVWR